LRDARSHHFAHIEIVLEKDPPTYAGLLRRFDVEPSRFCMVGNSVRSDILPVMALGGHGVHIPYELLCGVSQRVPLELK